jgi:hypothetical protein
MDIYHTFYVIQREMINNNNNNLSFCNIGGEVGIYSTYSKT